MLPFIIGGVALATIGYGINKCLNDEDCMDNIKDTISNGAMKAYEGIEKLEEKMGLNEYTFTKEEAGELALFWSLFKNELKETTPDTVDTKSIFTSLMQLKTMINANLQYRYQIAVCKMNEIEEDEIKEDFEPTEQMLINAKEYDRLLKAFYTKIDEQLTTNPSDDVTSYVEIVREFLVTKIIKDGELNDISSEIVEKGVNLLVE
jgi:hypothetical protein